MIPLSLLTDVLHYKAVKHASRFLNFPEVNLVTSTSGHSSSSFYHWTEWDIYACQYSTKGHFRIWMFVPYSTFVTLAWPSPLPHWAHLGWVGHIAVRWRSGQLQPGFKAKRRVKFGEVKFGSVRVKTYRLIRDTARLHGPLGRLISLWWDLVRIRVAEVVQRHEGPSPKSLDSDENFKP